MKELSKNINDIRGNGMIGVWKVKNKYFPKKTPAHPSAKLNLEGQIVSNHLELKHVYLEHFHHRMRSRPILKELAQHKVNIENKAEEMLKETKNDIPKDWTVVDIDVVLKSIKLNQSLDANGLSNNILTHDNIGDDLKRSIIILVNKIKNSMEVPQIIRNTHITAIPKKKNKSSMNLDFERGIFLVPKLRSILMKLVYNSLVDEVEEHLSLSNIGARKKRAPRDHLFVLYSVINDIIHGKKAQPVDLVFYDIKLCYDSLWVEKTLIDLYSNGDK